MNGRLSYILKFISMVSLMVGGTVILLYIIVISIDPVYAEAPTTVPTPTQAVELNDAQLESVRLASEAVNVLSVSTTDAELAALLAIRALNIAYSNEADLALQDALLILAPINALEYLGDPDIAFSPDGQHIAVSVQDVVRLWDVETAIEIHEFNGHTAPINAIAFSPDGRMIASASEDGHVRLWDVSSGEEVRQFVGHEGAVNDLAFSPNGAYIATVGDDSRVQLWDAASGEEVRQFIGHERQVESIAFSPDGDLLLTGGHGAERRLWDVETGELIREFGLRSNETVSSVAFSPDGQRILTNLNTMHFSVAHLWDIETGELVGLFRTPWINVVNFSPDGDMILIVTEAGVEVWDLENNTRIRQIKSLDRSGAFSPDGAFIVIANADGGYHLWDVDYRDFVNSACLRVFRDFTQDERQQFGITDNAPTCETFGGEG